MTVIWQPALSEEARRWRELAHRVTQEHFAPLAAELDREQRYPWENVRRLVEHKLAGLFIPKQFGGQGTSLCATAAVVETIASGCPSTAAILCTYQLGAFPSCSPGVMIRSSIISARWHVAWQRALRSRSAIPALTLPPFKPPRGARGDHWRLCGEKYWIGNGGASRYYVVFAKSDADRGARGISAFMVDKDQSGVVVVADKMGLRGTQTSNLRLDVTLPDSARIGEANGGLRSRHSMSDACWLQPSLWDWRSRPIAKRRSVASSGKHSAVPSSRTKASAFGLPIARSKSRPHA
jgi:alkylation response protein AidB-like acyl-CoA dehydrogenase